MTEGHQIIKIRRPKKRIPTWVYDFEQIKKILLRCFPKLQYNLRQRNRAGKWVRVINLYFRQNWSRGQIADEMDLQYKTIDRMIERIKKAGEGQRTDGSGPVGKPKGRPRKN